MKGKELKKITAKLLLSAMLVAGALVQKTYAQEAVGYIGLTAAPMFTGMSSDRSSIGSVIGYAAGITPEVKFGENFGIELDLMMTNKGGTKKYLDSLYLKSDNYYFDYNKTYAFTYAEAVLLFKWYIHIDHNPIIPYEAPGHHSFVFFEAGPYYAHMINYSASGSVTQYASNLYSRDTIAGTYVKATKFQDLTDSATASKILTTDIGVTFGVGVIFPVSHRGLLSFEARYSKGLVYIDNGEFGHYILQARVPATSPPTNAVWSYPAAVTTDAIGLFISYKYRIFGGGE